MKPVSPVTLARAIRLTVVVLLFPAVAAIVGLGLGLMWLTKQKEVCRMIWQDVVWLYKL